MYRTEDRPHPHPQRTAVDIATPVRLYINNGTKSEFAFPCWYQEIRRPVPAFHHNRQLHDHLGWPHPRHVDRSCQLWIPARHCCSLGILGECGPHCKHYVDFSRLHPIHLLSDYEGYSTASVAWATPDGQPPEGITVEAEIDPEEDWVVRVYVESSDPHAMYHPMKYLFTVFVHADERQMVNPITGEAGRTQPAKTDVVALAELTVLPSAYDREENYG